MEKLNLDEPFRRILKIALKLEEEDLGSWSEKHRTAVVKITPGNAPFGILHDLQRLCRYSICYRIWHPACDPGEDYLAITLGTCPNGIPRPSQEDLDSCQDWEEL